MKNHKSIQGRVVGDNSLMWGSRLVHCWTGDLMSAMAPLPLDLSPYREKIVEVRGLLRGDLWEARFEKVVEDTAFREITGEVTGQNIVQGPDGPITCYRHGMQEAAFLPLNLTEYMGQTITVGGELYGDTLYKAYVASVPEVPLPGDPEKEARSLNDLMIIRAANRQRIEAVNGNLGTALGFKWTNNRKTDHPCIIIFVPQKTAPELIPDEEKAPEMLEGPDGKWCLTDVVTGGKAESLDEIGPLPPISEENETIVQELKSGRLGLIGGIQLAFFGDGNPRNTFVGTAGIAVRHTESGEVGLLTNQHVAEVRGRKMFHPLHRRFLIGRTADTIEHVEDGVWYNNVVNEENSFVRSDCGFVAVDKKHAPLLRPGLHAIGTTGPLLRIDPGTMDIIGQKVISIGRTRGVQRGTVVAYAYEFHDEEVSIYTDLLIIGEDGNAFSWKGDSGKVIVTDDERHQPVALLWGGWQERLRHGREQEVWSYAIDLGKVLDRLGLELFE